MALARSSSPTRSAADHYTYEAYGLSIRSAIALPELAPAAGSTASDLTIELDAVHAAQLGDRPFNLEWHAPDDACLNYRDAGAFRVRTGSEITADPRPDFDDKVLRLYLLGPVLALALHQRGWLILHASAIGINGRAVAFLGGSGWGKSTMAAALHQRGHRLVADDFIAVPVAPGAGPAPMVYPGFPQLKLWPEAAASLGQDVARLPLLHPDFDKRAHRPAAGFAESALPLARLYVLADGGPMQIEHLDKQTALIELVRHSYAAQVMPRVEAATHLRQCAALLGQVPLCRLHRPRSLPGLPAVAEMVELDLAGNVSPHPAPHRGRP